MDEFKAFCDRYVVSKEPLVFMSIPAKEKRKYMMLCIMIHHFNMGKNYTEKEINDILKPMGDDYVMIRRYLIDYGFMGRTDNGKSYWLEKNPNDFSQFRLLD
jgi:hypothetical protein